MDMAASATLAFFTYFVSHIATITVDYLFTS